MHSLQEGSSDGQGVLPREVVGLPAPKAGQGRTPSLSHTETASKKHNCLECMGSLYKPDFTNPFLKSALLMSLFLLFSTGKPQVLAEASASQASCSSSVFSLSWTWKSAQTSPQVMRTLASAVLEYETLSDVYCSFREFSLKRNARAFKCLPS